MEEKDIELLTSPPLESNDYIKLFDQNGHLIHEGLLMAAPGLLTPYRDDGWGLWTYFFKNFPSGVSMCTPHQVELLDGSGYFMRGRPFLVMKEKNEKDPE